ncbi:STAS/SEC14 domain-containing protein [Arthrobacter sp. APC 3897]|uniref:STAS/SEC14 domain-containing protein n=1 Tax=Arthrobacter sp. APC 3897 TaxID=3035204 RepID=UPI0025B54CBE|nr:STAS/SEC14 domain-containing protein [Arthrobacter sp. APC 3897]MDN3481535.1 STAS/SEC14 domain-containing protein [Arthrobacter sp. APC 3897]
MDVSMAPEGHVLLILPPGETVTGPMAAAAHDEVARLAGSEKLPMLLVLTGVEAVTRHARSVFSNARSLAAVAVVGVTPVDRVIANFLLGGAVQPCPTRYFSNEQDALEWLQRKNVA